MKILVTCPPMIGMIDRFAPIFARRGLTFDAPEVTQTLSQAELVKTLGDYDGVDAVGHQAVSQDAQIVASSLFGRQGKIIQLHYWPLEEDLFVAVPPLRDVVRTPNTTRERCAAST